AELELHVRLEAERQLPFPSSELALDFSSLSSASPSSTNVMLAACRKEQVDERLTLLHAAGCNVSVMAMETQVVERAFRFVGGEAGQLTALVDLQVTSLVLHLMRDGRVIHWREQAFGGADSPDSLASCDSLAADLASQLQRSLHLLHSSIDRSEVERLWLSGVGAVRAGLAEKLAQLLSLPVRIANPVASFACSDAVAASGPAFFMATGLALRGLQDG